MKTHRYWIYPLLFFTWVAASSAEELPVVAIAEFESGMGTYQSQLFASNLASQAQAAMANSDAMRLVERAQLELAATELALEPYLSPRVGESLAVGRWVGAELVMLGTLERDPEGAWTLALEVVDPIEAVVLAEMTLPLPGDPAHQPTLEAETFLSVGKELIQGALATQAHNSEAKLIISPLFFDFIGSLRNLEPLREEFFRELQAQVEADHEVRLLRFPRVRHVQAEMELRLDGLAEMTRRRPTRPPVFIWGGLRESDAEGKTPEEVPLRAFLSIRTHGIEAKEIQFSGTVGEAPALMKQLVRSMIGHAKQQSREPVISPGPNPAEAEEMMRHIKRLEDEFDIRLRSKEATETLSSLGIYVDSLYQLAAFLSPDDPEIHRSHLLSRSKLFRPNQRLDFTVHMEIHRRWRLFEQRFPGQHNRRSVFGSINDALLLLRGINITGAPRDWPPEMWQRLKEDLQARVVATMEAVSPELFMENTNIGNLMLYHVAFPNAEKRARFTEMMWPVYVVHYTRPRSGRSQDWRAWEKTLVEIFSAVGQPEKARVLASLPDREQVRESWLPEDLRFMVKRPDILPPAMDWVPRTITFREMYPTIDALHFDGKHLWVAAFFNQAYGTNKTWRQRIVNSGQSSKLFRLHQNHMDLQEIELKLPSKICALASDGHDLWAGTQRDGILQLNRERGALVRSWGIDEGLPTRHVYALAASGNGVTAGGGDLHRGYLFRISSGGEGAVNLSLPGWREDVAKWRAEDIPKSQFGEVTILLHAHGRNLAVAGGAQAILWKEGGEDALNLMEAVLGLDSRYGASPQNGTVISATHDAQGWWFGTDNGLARLAPDGTVLQRWKTPVGGYFFEQKGWVPSMRSSGALLRNFECNTRLVGAVTALAADGDFLFAAVSTERDHYLPSEWEGAYLFVMHIPSGKWVGRVELPARATTMAQDDARLWIGHAGPSAVLLEFDKSALTRVPPEHHVADVPSPRELETAIGKLTIREQACHAFFQGNYQRVVDLLGELPMEAVSLGELFLIAFSNDENGLSQPDVAHAYFEEILRRQPHSFWRAEAEHGLKSLGLEPESGNTLRITDDD